jgi:hypothetical protein
VTTNLAVHLSGGTQAGRRRELTTGCVVKNFAKFAKADSERNRLAILLALIVVPGALVALLREIADHIAPLVSGTGEALNLNIILLLQFYPVAHELLQVRVGHRENLPIGLKLLHGRGIESVGWAKTVIIGNEASTPPAQKGRRAYGNCT